MCIEVDVVPDVLRYELDDLVEDERLVFEDLLEAESLELNELSVSSVSLQI